MSSPRRKAVKLLLAQRLSGQLKWSRANLGRLGNHWSRLGRGGRLRSRSLRSRPRPRASRALGQGQEPHAPTMNGGALAEEPPMPKLEFREKKCLEYFRKRSGIGFLVRMGVYL